MIYRSVLLKTVLLFVGIAGCGWMISCRTEKPGMELKFKTLAVLPFEAVENDPGTDYLGFALTDQIILKLSYVHGVVVRSSDAVRNYAHAEFHLADVARELDVEFILKGSFQNEGDRFRLNAELIHVPSNEDLWNETFDIEYTELFTVQDSVSRGVIKGLQLRLSAEERSRLTKDNAKNPVAYERYLRAMAAKPMHADDWMDRIRLLENSVEIDSAYTPALASLGYGYLQVAGKVGGRGGYYELAEKTLHRALVMNRECPQTLRFLGSLYAKIGKSEDSAALLQEGLSVNPSIPDFYSGLGYVYRYAGLMDESIKAYRRAQVLDSSLRNLISTQGQITKSLIYKGAYEDAATSHKNVKEYLNTLQQPTDIKQLFYEGVINFYSENLDRAISLFDSASTMDEANVWSLFGQAYKAAALGLDERLVEILKYLENRNIVDGERRYRLVHFYALAGMVEDALRNLKKSIEGGFFNYPYIRTDPLTECVRRSEKFQMLLAQARDRHEAFRRRFCGPV